jgi:hypothetical protein
LDPDPEPDPDPLVTSQNVTDPQHWMQGTKDHFFLDMADDVVRGSIVLNKGVKTWPPNPPIAVAAAAPSKAGFRKKTRFFFKLTQPSGVFFVGFFNFFLYICPEERIFRVFSVFQEYF